MLWSWQLFMEDRWRKHQERIKPRCDFLTNLERELMLLEKERAHIAKFSALLDMAKDL